MKAGQFYFVDTASNSSYSRLSAIGKEIADYAETKYRNTLVSSSVLQGMANHLKDMAERLWEERSKSKKPEVRMTEGANDSVIFVSINNDWSLLCKKVRGVYSAERIG